MTVCNIHTSWQGLWRWGVVVSISVMGLGVSGVAGASEAPVRSLFDETRQLIEYMDAEMADMQAEFEAADASGMPARSLSDYERGKAAIEDLEAQIGLTDNWKTRLPNDLAEQTRSLVSEFAWTDKALLDAKRGQINRDQKVMCDSIMADMADTVGAINQALKTHRLYSQEARAAVRPYRPKVDEGFSRFELGTKANIQKYYTAADALNMRRGEVARRIWRFFHAYEDAGLEVAKDNMSRTLRDSLGMSDEAYVNPVQAAKHFSAFQSSTICPYSMGMLTQYEENDRFPHYVAYIGDRINEPVGSFDEQENFLERPPMTGDTQLERMARALSHRQMQRFRLLGAMDAVSTKLKEANKAYAELVKLDDRFAKAADEYQAIITPLIPELEHKARIDKILAELAEAESQSERLSEEIRDERDAQREATANAQLATFVQTGADQNGIDIYRQTNPGEDGRTVSQIVAPLKRIRALHVEARDKAQAAIDRFFDYGIKSSSTSDGEKVEIYKRLKANYDKFKGEVEAIDRRIAKAESLRIESDYDETRLVALGDEKREVENRIQSLSESIEEVREQFALSRSGTVDREGLYRYGLSLSIALSEMEKLDGNLRSEIEALRPIAVRLERDRRSARPASETLADMNALTEGVEPLRVSLANRKVAQRQKVIQLRNETVGLGQKLDLVNETLFSLKKAATAILQRELPTSGIPKNDEILTQIQDYREALTDIQGHLENGSKQIKEKAATIDKYYDDFEKAMTTDQKLGVQRVVANMKWVNGYVEEIAEATALLGKATDQAISIVEYYNDIRPPADASPANAFKHIGTVLKRAEDLSSNIPVVGVLSEYYFGYLNYTITQIEAGAKGIKEESVRKLTKKGPDGVCLFRTPEEHLYTQAELEASGQMDVAIMTRWFGWGGRDEAIGIQSRRVIALLGADNIRIACEKPANCQTQTTCTRQGRIGWSQ